MGLKDFLTSLKDSFNEGLHGDPNVGPYNRVIFDNFLKLGATREDRIAAIDRMFESKQESIFYQYHWVHNENAKNSNNKWVPKECYKKISLVRNLSTMEPREREFLRQVMLYFNDGLLTESNYNYYLFAFVHGDGKGTILEFDYYTYSDYSGVRDGASVGKYIQDQWNASSEGAINDLLTFTQNLRATNQLAADAFTERISGNHAWYGANDVINSVFESKSEYSLSLGQLQNTQTNLQYSGEGSLITIAPPGSGKTQCFVIPNMLSWRGAAIVLDIKGEIFASTSKWREANIGRVYRFSPLDPSNSNSYNPLTFIRDDSDFIWEDSRFLADMMIVPTGTADPFWENMARDVLTSAIAHITFNNEPENRAMSKVLDIIYGIGWDEMITMLKANVLISSMRRMGHALDELERKQRDSILKMAQSSLSAWMGERIAKVTQKSDWHPLDLRSGSPTIYICINPNELESYLSVLRVFIAQHIRMLTSQLPERGTPPVLFMLDEMPRLKKMPPIDEALNIGRQYGIKLWMFAQSYGQIKEVYPDPEGLLGSCVVRTFMNLPLNDELTTKISDQLGFREGPLDSTRQKLVEPLELAGPKYKNTILVLASNTKPIKLDKRFAYEDAEIMEKVGSA